MYTKIKAKQVPKRERKMDSRLAGTNEWQKMKRDIDRGLKVNEALQLTLTDADKKRIGIKNRRTAARFVQNYITDNKLKYMVKSFHRDGLDYVIVVGPSRRA